LRHAGAQETASQRGGWQSGEVRIGALMTVDF
jgi:hypothetical protein